MKVKRYFINPEIKRSSCILLCLMSIFLFATFFILKVHDDNLKAGYIKSLGAITARVVQENPELEKEIIPLIAKEVSEEEAIKGKFLLKQYGLTENLESELFPYINKTILRNKYSIITLFILMTLVFFFLNYLQYGFFYRKIRKVALGAKKVIEGQYDLSIREDREGDFSKMANAFNSMREIIRNNLSELKKEKQFLVDLLSDISHQLKTPLSSMIVYNDIMVNKELSKEQRQTFLLNNQSQLHRMNWLIQSILKLAKLDANAIELVKENQSLNETVQDAIDALESKAFEGNVKIILKEKEEIIFAHDRLWLEEALINIIKNGIEHTPKGGEILIELTESLVYQRVTIEDSGEGIREADLPNIFKRFYKAKTSKNKDSVGIGLALAKSIVEAHYGIIEVKSEIGLGTKFAITFLKY
jgi:signal transduction histidine kinase